jgi:8-oxo-dGTP diphosphatase
MDAGIDYIGVTVTFYCHDGNGRFLLHKRSQSCRDEQGRWDVGGGQLDFGEDPEAGVLREVLEEYGCHGVIDEALLPCSVIRQVGDRKSHWIAFPFIVRVNPSEVINNEPDKIEELGWFRLSELPQPLHSAVEARVIRDKERFKILSKYSK